ncbi:MAG: hypothetical protein K9N10_21585 [Deltaproteobacteria bacterium]|nr:hypothetical protein [Deltaproteobacteria bacterium]
MKCPKCNYTSFDYSQVCPKCGKDNSEEQDRLKFSPNKPNPPFFLASLIGAAGAENPEMADSELNTHFSDDAYGEMGAKDLLIALDDLDGDAGKPDSPEMLDPSGDEIVFETGDLVEEPSENSEPANDEILFDLEPSSEGIESDDGDPLDMGNFISDSATDTRIPVESAKIEEKKPVARPIETAAADDDEVDLFLADEPESTEKAEDAKDVTEIDFASEDLDSPELFLSLDDLSDGDSKQRPSESSAEAEDEILFELEETPDPDGTPSKEEITDAKDFWNSDEINKQTADSEPEKVEDRKTDPSTKKSTDLEEEANLFSDLDIEPLDLDLSLEDLEEKPE